MARVLKLKHSATELDLLASEGAGLRMRKWFPLMAELIYADIPPYVAENLDVLVDRTSHNNLATSMQALDDMRIWANRFHRDGIVQEPVWLHAKMDGETGERRAYVRALRGAWKSEQMGTVGPPAAYDALLQLQMERHPFWERTAHTTGTQGSALTGAAIKHNYGTVAGDVGARIPYLAIQRSSGEVDRVWSGFRSTKFGDPANFVAIWECEVAGATAGTDCSAPTTDATASPGSGNTKRVVDFATTPGWAKRLTIELADVAVADIIDQLRRFLWLFRTKVDASTECEVQLRWGFTNISDDDYVQGPTLAVTNTDWDYKEMGICKMPIINTQIDTTLINLDTLLDQATVQIWARRTSGTGDLHLDCLCPVPLDEGWLVAKDINAVDAGDALCYMQTPADVAVAWTESISGIKTWVTWSDNNYRFPSGSGRLIIVFARASSSVLTDAINVFPYWYSRYVNLRGAD